MATRHVSRHTSRPQRSRPNRERTTINVKAEARRVFDFRQPNTSAWQKNIRCGGIINRYLHLYRIVSAAPAFYVRGEPCPSQPAVASRAAYSYTVRSTSTVLGRTVLGRTGTRVVPHQSSLYRSAHHSYSRNKPVYTVRPTHEPSCPQEMREDALSLSATAGSLLVEHLETVYAMRLNFSDVQPVVVPPEAAQPAARGSGQHEQRRAVWLEHL
jgi:hypothetical protein